MIQKFLIRGYRNQLQLPYSCKIFQKFLEPAIISLNKHVIYTFF